MLHATRVRVKKIDRVSGQNRQPGSIKRPYEENPDNAGKAALEQEKSIAKKILAKL